MRFFLPTLLLALLQLWGLSSFVLPVSFAAAFSAGPTSRLSRRAVEVRLRSDRPILGGNVSRGSKLKRDAVWKCRRGDAPQAKESKLFAISAAAPIGAQRPDEGIKPFNPGPAITFGKSGLKLNIFGFIYGTVAIALGLVWWTSLTICQLLYKIGLNKLDPYRRIPVTISSIWGWLVLHLMFCLPKLSGKENLEEFLKENRGKRGAQRRPAMFVANHSSWMDIPFFAIAIGWKNYKIIAKKELLKVPILSKSIRVGGNLVLDRTNRRSQMETYKKGVQWLKDGVNLVTFPEGTRTKNSRMGSFKKGAFKMAEAVNAPIIPLSISYADKVQPLDYVFPVRPSRSIRASVHIGEPIPTEGKSDEELMIEVHAAIAEHLPESQKPDPDTPVFVK